MKKKEHSKYYYEYDRNMSTTLDSMTNTDKHLLARDKRVPEYYKGKEGYQARKVCDNFDLTYHLATATTYILRAYKKHDTPVDCIKKAIAHLEFELEKINEK
jgi:ribosome-associated translation inhibitor RaiA